MDDDDDDFKLQIELEHKLAQILTKILSQSSAKETMDIEELIYKELKKD